VKALDLDPEFARAAVGLGWAHLQSWQLLWSTDAETLERARELAQRELARDDTLADAHRLLAQIHLWKKEHDAAIAEAQKTITLAPSDADGYETLAEVLGWAGQPEESLRFIRQAMRLNLRYPFSYLWTLAHSDYLTGRTPDAISAFRQVVEQHPNFVAAHAYLAVAYSEMGRPADARLEWETASRLSPAASFALIRQRLPYQRPADLDRFLTAMHQARFE
jgi:tetratricopeptide (TPR) repeat protein